MRKMAVKKMSLGQNVLWLAVSIGFCQCAGAIGSIFTMPSIASWYAFLAKPFFTPPNWLFGPVWITLYTLMGVALFLVWKKAKPSALREKALKVFAVQLVLNTLWSIVFFGAHRLWSGFLVIVFLWAFILWSILLFYKIDKRAAWLLVPYLASWVTIATLLNLGVALLN